MTKEEIFDYVMESPENTNPAVLRSMLNELDGGFGGGVLNITDTEGTLDKTFGEIQEAFESGTPVIIY